VRVYFWRGKGHRKIRMTEAPGSRVFAERYEQLIAAAEAGEIAASGDGPVAKPGTYGWLCTHYVASTAFRELEPKTQATYRRTLDATLDEPIYPGAEQVYRDFPLDRLTVNALCVLRDRKAALPGSAMNRVKAIRAAFKWAMSLDPRPFAVNPARDLAKPRLPKGGHHTWMPEEIERYETCHPVGTKARLALALLLNTGARRSDVVRLGRQHRRMVFNEETGTKEPWLKFTAHKNRNRSPVEIEIPVLPELDRIIADSPTGDLTYLVTEFGRPFTIAGFGNWFRARCDEAGLGHCSAHGLRKAGAVVAAENGATAHQLMSIFGWINIAEAERYTRAARRKRMARNAVKLLSRRGGS
jgi:integrase